MPLWPGGSMVDPLRPRGAGQRSVPVTVEHQVAPVKPGYPVDDWVPLVQTYWCARKDIWAKEAFDAGQPSASADTYWQGAYLPELDPDRLDVPKLRRFRYRGRVFDIVAAAVVGRREGLEFLTLAKSGGTRT